MELLLLSLPVHLLCASLPLIMLCFCNNLLNLLHLNIGMHIFHTVFYTFPEVLTRKFCLTTRASLAGDHFILFILITVIQR